jgi:hypothetical protein
MIPPVKFFFVMIENIKQNEWVCRYNDGDLHEPELSAFLKMVSSDRNLQRELILDRKLDEILSDTDLLAFRKILLNSCRKKSRPWYQGALLIAATLLLLVSVCAIWLIVKKPGNADLAGSYRTVVKHSGNPNSKVGEKPMRSMKVKSRRESENKIAQNAVKESAYVPLAYMERLCGESLRAEPLKIISPLPGTEFVKKRQIRFEWESTVHSGCILEIMNNKGDMISSIDTEGAGIFVFNAGSFSRGLYYWKLLDHEDLLYVGKFSLK